jgi:hypothetical protein
MHKKKDAECKLRVNFLAGRPFLYITLTGFCATFQGIRFKAISHAINDGPVYSDSEIASTGRSRIARAVM